MPTALGITVGTTTSGRRGIHPVGDLRRPGPPYRARGGPRPRAGAGDGGVRRVRVDLAGFHRTRR